MQLAVTCDKCKANTEISNNIINDPVKCSECGNIIYLLESNNTDIESIPDYYKPYARALGVEFVEKAAARVFNNMLKSFTDKRE